MKPRKIAVIGMGHIGGTIAHILAEQEEVELILIDLNLKAAQGKVLDILQAASALGKGPQVTATEDYAHLKGVDLIIVTAGLPRKEGMSREDLIAINAKIVNDIGSKIKAHNQEALIIVITNPLDAMVMHMQKVTGFAPNKVIGMAGVLDCSRLRFFLAQELKISPAEIHPAIIGSHSDSMIPLLKYTTIAGVSLQQMIEEGKISQAKVNEIFARTKVAGAEIIKLLGTSAYYAPARCAVEMGRAYLFNKKSQFYCAAYLSGEYGISDVYLGVPVVVGSNGVEKIIELTLSDEEKNSLVASADLIKKLIKNNC